MKKSVTKAVFPVNGFGTRFLPITKSVPKEMLPIVDRPLIQYAVDEAVKAGITELIFVTGREKRSIEDYFDAYPELERMLAEAQKQELLVTLGAILPSNVKCVYIRQPKPLGLGHAVLCAQPAVGDSPFAVILPDDVVDANPSCIGQLIEARETTGTGSVLAVESVPLTDTNKYGIVSVEDKFAKTSVMHSIVEKPAPEVAPSTMAVIGRYVFEPKIFDYLKMVAPGISGEIQLTDAIAASLTEIKTFVHRFDGQRFDCGSKQGFIDANVHYARKRGFKIN